ncbi:hypothetical protein AKG30_02370 [Lacticaseibacillus paracasei]|uniref:hypothetical protein n=1 Tax=Lacticaseibacillus paracasei TaxID=1597 RepID=UPI00067FA87D|nr:hypothetical protein [Lacticaseibacillus paracasei]AKU33895.1 hypothetical protein AKG30_02370 [Lacticaseibacillus paracasei]
MGENDTESMAEAIDSRVVYLCGNKTQADIVTKTLHVQGVSVNQVMHGRFADRHFSHVGIYCGYWTFATDKDVSNMIIATKMLLTKSCDLPNHED